MSIRSKIQALITAANAKTGESDTTLTDAVQTLVDGYGQGGGGGASGLSLLASGSFTLASQGTTLSIPVSFSGTPVNVFVIYRGDGTGIAHTHAWAFMATFPLSELDTLFPASADKGVRSAVAMLANGKFNILNPIRARMESNNTIIDVRQTGYSYPCLAGQYDWYIYGEAAS